MHVAWHQYAENKGGSEVSAKSTRLPTSGGKDILVVKGTWYAVGSTFASPGYAGFESVGSCQAWDCTIGSLITGDMSASGL
jgi:hypothetical protein